MSHVAFVSFTGFRVREQEMLALGMALPGLKQRAAAIGQLPTLGLLTLAGLTPPPWTCSYHETARAVDLVAEVLHQRPTLVAVSALTASVEEAYRFIEQIRKQGVRVVLGGLHATACPDEARLHADAIIVGEGEPVWPQILTDAAADDLHSVYRAAAPLDLADAPVPRFDLLGNRPRPRMTLQTQRGCPLACEFCAASRLLGPFRLKPLANLRRELAAITALTPRPVLELADDNTFLGTREVGPFLDVLSEAKARWFTEADWRIGERPDWLEGLAAAGCVQVLVGIESLVFRPTGMGPKQTEWPRIMDAVRAIQEAGVAVIGCFIVGCDGETRQSLDRLTETILASPLADVQLTLQTPFPGTALHRRLKEQGRLLPDRGWSHYTLFDVTYRPDRMSVEELEKAFRETVGAVFSAGPSSRRQAIRKQTWHPDPEMRP